MAALPSQIDRAINEAVYLALRGTTKALDAVLAVTDVARSVIPERPGTRQDR